MFLTMTEFEQPIPVGLKTLDVQHWMATVLSTQLPWYLVTYGLRDKNGYHVQTATIAWETALCSWLKSVDRESVIAINLMAWNEASLEWTMKRIEAIWRAGPSEVQTTGPIVFRLCGESELWCANDMPVAGEGRRRRLLVRVPPPQERRGRLRPPRKKSVGGRNSSAG